jgi:hypothetical protein
VVIDLKTMNALGAMVPKSSLPRADEVIERGVFAKNGAS